MAERETVYVLVDNGTVMPHDLPLPSGIADRVARGQLRLVNADGSAIEAHGVLGGEGELIRRPGVNAAKTEWVAYAVAQGMSVSEADGMTKADLIEKFGEKK